MPKRVESRTPGHFTVRRVGASNLWAIVTNREGLVAMAYESAADAELFAAAPEMLELLQALADHFHDGSAALHADIANINTLLARLKEAGC